MLGFRSQKLTPRLSDESNNLSVTRENSMHGFTTSGFSSIPAHGMDEGLNMSSTGYSYDGMVSHGDDYTNSIHSSSVGKQEEEIVSASNLSSERGSSISSGTAGTHLPDDFQQALDIIYAGPEKPASSSVYRFGPPAAPPPASYDYSATSYNSYGTFQHPPPPIANPGIPPPGYEGYGGQSSVYEELDDGPPGETGVMALMSDSAPKLPNVIESKSVAEVSQTTTYEPPAASKPTMDADEMDDLRMLGIDVDDIAAAALR
jgi:hypothetical protein